jgi:hypothetical protein
MTYYIIALDHIISQIMEQGSSSRPVPATEDVMEQLHREVLEEECKSLSRSLLLDFLSLNTVSSAAGTGLRSV